MSLHEEDDVDALFKDRASEQDMLVSRVPLYALKGVIACLLSSIPLAFLYYSHVLTHIAQQYIQGQFIIDVHPGLVELYLKAHPDVYRSLHLQTLIFLDVYFAFEILMTIHYLRTHHLLQSAPIHAPILPKSERRRLFLKCFSSIGHILDAEELFEQANAVQGLKNADNGLDSTSASPSLRHIDSIDTESKSETSNSLDTMVRSHKLFRREIRRILSKWFHGAPPKKIFVENVKEWIAWALFNMPLEKLEKSEHQEIEDVLIDFEMHCGYITNQDSSTATSGGSSDENDILKPQARKLFKPGRNPDVKCLRLSLDPMKTAPRPFAIYGLIRIFQLSTESMLHLAGFTKGRRKHVPYWIRTKKQTSPSSATHTDLPIVFLHGLGFGIAPYVPFLLKMSKKHSDRTVLILELPFVGMKFDAVVPTVEQFVHSMDLILKDFKISKASFLCHSFGSLCLAWILKNRPTYIHSIVFVDPVCFLLWEADLAYNAIYRNPDTISSLATRYFVINELYTAHTLSRHFWWWNNIVFADQLESNELSHTTIILSGDDHIIDAVAVRKYLQRHVAITNKSQQKSKIDLVFMDNHRHGEGLMWNVEVHQKIFEAI